MYKEKACQECGSIFKPVAPAQLFCQECKVIADARQKERRNKAAYAKFCEKQIALGRGHVIGVGKGGNNRRGKDSNFYKNGYSEFRSVSKTLRKQINFCQRCNEDLSNASPYRKCVHHKDRDRTNNALENLIVLCKRCHQIEHKCWENLKGATTIPEGSTSQANGDGSAEHT